MRNDEHFDKNSVRHFGVAQCWQAASQCIAIGVRTKFRTDKTGGVVPAGKPKF
ncbi:MAG: hypothetical protein RBR97_06830 [Bacteroidales bacterium]|jgi:hypothetical protein|nr:hypothetical protein [Bacteroidales bacterium]